MKYSLSTIEVPENSVVVLKPEGNFSEDRLARVADQVKQVLQERLGHDKFSVMVISGIDIEVMDKMEFQKALGEGEFLKEAQPEEEDLDDIMEDDPDYDPDLEEEED